MIKPARIASVDLLRALTMFLMIWVNDFWTLEEVPKWLRHAQSGEDYLGFSDLIFPWFLFIVGMSIPFSTENRLKRGERTIQITYHIVLRTLALIVMGLFHVNLENYNQETTLLSKPVFVILTTAAFFLVWNRYPFKNKQYKWLFITLRITGILLLGTMFMLYEGNGQGGTVSGFGIHWWGILGLIGWVYLPAALIYLVFRRSLIAMSIAFLVFFALNILSSSGISYQVFPWQSGDWIPGSGGLQAIGIGGIITSLLLTRFRETKQPLRMYLVIAGIALAAFTGGLLLREYFIISKISGTPTWILLSLSTAMLLFIAMHWIVDLKQMDHLFRPIRIAGVATLTCYLVPYFVYSFRSILGIELPDFLTTGWIGLTKSLVYALLIIGITRVLTRLNIQLKI